MLAIKMDSLDPRGKKEGLIPFFLYHDLHKPTIIHIPHPTSK